MKEKKYMDKRLKVQFEFINLHISIAYTEGRTDVESFVNKTVQIQST